MAALETRTGEPLATADGLLRPVSRVLRLRFPKDRAALVWSRPIGVIAEDRDGSRRFLRIPDPTRRLQCLLLAGALVTAVLLRLNTRSPARRTRRPGGNP